MCRPDDFPPYNPTFTETVVGEHAAAEVAARLVSASRWFEVMPYPEDHWKFTLKDEPGARLFFREEED